MTGRKALAYLIYPRSGKMWMISTPLLDIANWRLLWLPIGMVRRARAK
jgi:hypothetical protein